MANRKITIVILGAVFILSAGLVSAETSPDGCVSWNTYCVGISVTADLSWGALTQEDINEIRSDCTLQSVNYTVEVTGVGSVGTGGSTSYSWPGLSPDTLYQWRVLSDYQCTVSWRSGSVPMDIYSFTTLDCNQSPSKPAPTSESWDHCIFQELSMPTFHWVYSDPDGDPQQATQIKIYGETTLDETNTCPPTCLSYSPSSSWVDDNLDWNKAYNWQVRVQDDHDNWSQWSDPDQFITPLHAYPSPDFGHEPAVPTAEEEILFVDSSVCYNPGGSSYSCKDNAGNRYQWDFEDDGVVDCDSNVNPSCRGNATTSYSESGNYLVRLEVTDGLGTCDTTGDTPITTSLPLPEYKEVPPVIWLKKALASIYEFFNNLFKI